ncbi:hypothetical protein HDU76_010921 [Blyttiomyces sp. JEL0837]|nr:hypothetical protein HDU76_010921 [Blyttiomyces sp. JEL0837]
MLSSVTDYDFRDEPNFISLTGVDEDGLQPIPKPITSSSKKSFRHSLFEKLMKGLVEPAKNLSYEEPSEPLPQLPRFPAIRKKKRFTSDLLEKFKERHNDEEGFSCRGPGSASAQQVIATEASISVSYPSEGLLDENEGISTDNMSEFSLIGEMDARATDTSVGEVLADEDAHHDDLAKMMSDTLDTDAMEVEKLDSIEKRDGEEDSVNADAVQPEIGGEVVTRDELTETVDADVMVPGITEKSAVDDGLIQPAVDNVEAEEVIDVDAAESPGLQHAKSKEKKQANSGLIDLTQIPSDDEDCVLKPMASISKVSSRKRGAPFPLTLRVAKQRRIGNDMNAVDLLWPPLGSYLVDKENDDWKVFLPDDIMAIMFVDLHAKNRMAERMRDLDRRISRDIQFHVVTQLRDIEFFEQRVFKSSERDRYLYHESVLYPMGRGLEQIFLERLNRMGGNTRKTAPEPILLGQLSPSLLELVELESSKDVDVFKVPDVISVSWKRRRMNRWWDSEYLLEEPGFKICSRSVETAIMGSDEIL